MTVHYLPHSPTTGAAPWELPGEGKTLADVCRALEVSEPTFHRWRAQYRGRKADDAKRLKDLEQENARLKKLLAGAELGRHLDCEHSTSSRISGRSPRFRSSLSVNLWGGILQRSPSALTTSFVNEMTDSFVTVWGVLGPNEPTMTVVR